MVKYYKCELSETYYAITENGSLVVHEDINAIQVGTYILNKSFSAPDGWEEITDIEFDLARSKVQHQVNKAILEVLQKGVAA